MARNPPFLSASDIERYGYCPLNWWLKYQGHEAVGEALERGTRVHAQVGEEISEIQSQDKESTQSEMNIKIFAIIAILLAINGIIIVLSHEFPHQQYITVFTDFLLVLAVLWVVVAGLFFIQSARYSYRRKLPQGKRPWIARTSASKTGVGTNGELAGSGPDSGSDSGPGSDSRTGAEPSTVRDPTVKTPLFTRRHLVWMAIITGVLAITGYMIAYPPPSEVFSRFFTVSALMWLLGTIFFLYLILRREKHKDKDSQGIEPSVHDTRTIEDQSITTTTTTTTGEEIEKVTRLQYFRHELQHFGPDEKLLISFGAVSSFLAINAIMLERKPSGELGIYLLLLAFLWLMGTFIFFYFSFRRTLTLRDATRTSERTLAEMTRAQARAQEQGKTQIQVVTREAETIPEPALDPTKQAAQLKRSEEKLIHDSERGVVWFALVALVLSLNSMIFFYQPLGSLSNILEIIAMIWLIGAFFFFYHYLKNTELAGRLREMHGLLAEQVEYSDALDENADLLVSKTNGIRGRPDYVLYDDSIDQHIPIEVKTGSVPRGPYFSHILQLAAYCLLVEERYGSCSFGKLRYIPTKDREEETDRTRIGPESVPRTIPVEGDETKQIAAIEKTTLGGGKTFEIRYDQQLKELLLDKVEDMRAIIRMGEAHRNHNRPGKCRHCSRREGCPERLD